MSAEPALADYYARRAPEYERIYAKPERQADLEALRARVPDLLAARHVYEVACGTGYWTQYVAEQAASVFATDLNDEVLAIASQKSMPPGRVTYACANAFAPPAPPRPCNGGLAAFWWSHLRRGEETTRFLRAFASRLQPGARLVLIDNRYVPGSSTPISRTDAEGNSYQERCLADGSAYEVLKNFPDRDEMWTVLREFTAAVVWEELEYYWLAWADLR